MIALGSKRFGRLMCLAVVATVTGSRASDPADAENPAVARHRAGIDEVWRKAMAVCSQDTDGGARPLRRTAPSPALQTELEKSPEVIDVKAMCFNGKKGDHRMGALEFASLRGKTKWWGDPPGFESGVWQRTPIAEGGYVSTSVSAPRVHVRREADVPGDHWLTLDVYLEARP